MNYFFKGDMIIDLYNNIPFIHARDLLKVEKKDEKFELEKSKQFNFLRQVFKDSTKFLNPMKLG